MFTNLAPQLKFELINEDDPTSGHWSLRRKYNWLYKYLGSLKAAAKKSWQRVGQKFANFLKCNQELYHNLKAEVTSNNLIS